MKLVGIIDRLNEIGAIKRCRHGFRRSAPMSEPDILDIPRKEKLSRFQKLKRVIKGLTSNLDAKMIKDFESCSVGDFFQKAGTVILKSHKIPEELGPSVTKAPASLSKKVAMAYDFLDNVVYVQPEMLNKSRGYLFSYFKHELIHQKQNYQIFQTEGLGEKAVKEYAKIKNEFQVKSFIERYSKISDAELENLKPQLGEAYEWVLDLRKAVKAGPEAIKAFENKLKEHDYDAIVDAYEQFRRTIIKEMGTIPAGSEEAKLSQKYLDGFLKSYKNPVGFKALNTETEKEAYASQIVAIAEYYVKKFGL